MPRRRRNRKQPRRRIPMRRVMIGSADVKAVDALADYVKCKMNPFGAHMKSGVPDGGSAGRVVIDHLGTTTIVVPNNGSFWFKTMPGMPCTGMAKYDGTTGTPWLGMTVDGGSYANGAAVIDSDNTDWWPCCVPADWSTYSQIPILGAGKPLEIPVPYGAARARVVSQALRVYYQSNTWLSTGVLNAYSDAYQLGAVQISAFNIGLLSNLAANLNYTAGNINCQSLDFALARTYIQGMKTLYPTDTFQMVAPFTGSGHDFTKVYTSPPVMYDSSTAHGMMIQVNAAMVNGGMAFLDPNFQSITLHFQGLVANSVVRIEIATCVEYEPTATSSFAAFTSPSTTANKEAITSVDAVANKVPLSTVSQAENGVSAQKVIQQAAAQTGTVLNTGQQLQAAAGGGVKTNAPPVKKPTLDQSPEFVKGGVGVVKRQPAKTGRPSTGANTKPRPKSKPR